jgi:hypothetical protein
MNYNDIVIINNLMIWYNYNLNIKKSENSLEEEIRLVEEYKINNESSLNDLKLFLKQYRDNL